MHKVLLCISLLFNTLKLDMKSNISIESITYEVSKDNFINLEIDLYSFSMDIVEMTINFYDSNMAIKYNEYFSSSLSVEGNKKTMARIPFEIKDNMILFISFFSNNEKQIFEEIKFPIYMNYYSVCDLSNNGYCESKMPKMIKYRKGNIEEIYDKLFLINRNAEYLSFRNYIPLEKIKLNSNFDVNGASANLYIEEKIEGLELYYNGEYQIPLVVSREGTIINFKLDNGYFIDVINGCTYEDYEEGTVFSDNILLPYYNEIYDMFIEIEGISTFEKIIIEFKCNTKGKLYDSCRDSKYCLKRDYSI